MVSPWGSLCLRGWEMGRWVAVFWCAGSVRCVPAVCGWWKEAVGEDGCHFPGLGAKLWLLVLGECLAGTQRSRTSTCCSFLVLLALTGAGVSQFQCSLCLLSDFCFLTCPQEAFCVFLVLCNSGSAFPVLCSFDFDATHHGDTFLTW